MAHLSEVAPGKTHTVLMVGKSPQMHDLERHLGMCAGVLSIRYGDFSRDLIERLKPDSILCPAIGEDFDCIEIADFLASTCFQGTLRVFCGTELHHGVIRRDLCSRYPNHDFDILTFATKPRALTRLH
ncbi:hypothetical protein [Celeribacter litoreus]|uniref:hypothetical protein n=1 Tax=Celeribacter litoreus TaxID=2876714 RepID=UPI001CC90DC0|nr:hypothetical protein [Celeribacter litoreus]